MAHNSDASLNAALVVRDTSPLKQALLEFGQSWLIDALGPDLAAGGVLSFVKDWGLTPTLPPPVPYPDVAPELKARMIAYAVALMSNIPLSAAAAGAVGGYPIALPAYFQTQAADSAAWAAYKSPSEFTFHDALRLWSRRVALSLYIDGANLVPWRLRDFPAWQVVQMLSWLPFAPNNLNDVMSGTWRGHSPVRANGNWYSCDFVWAPDPLTEHTAAIGIIGEALASTPRQALLAIRTCMAQRRALHGQQEWNYFWGKDDEDRPPGGPYENNCNPLGNVGYYLSMAQWLRHGWGECSVSANAMMLLMRSINVPAAAIHRVCIDNVAQVELAPAPSAWSIGRRAANTVGIRSPVAGSQCTHTCCYAFGAGLACSHGDFNVIGPGDGVAFGDDTLSGWLPWRLQLAMHTWAAASTLQNSSDDFYRRVLLIDALRSAATDPDFAQCFQPFLPTLEASAAAATVANWTTSSAANAPPSLREWIVFTSFWPVGRRGPALQGMATLLGQHAEALPAPRWQPTFNTAFANTTVVTRQALARAVRELQTPMSGLVTTEPSALPREAYEVEIDGVTLDLAGSVAARTVLCAVAAHRALQKNLPVNEELRLLAAHSYDIYGLSERAASSGAWEFPNADPVHARAFPTDMQFWFQVASSTAPGAAPSTAACKWESTAMETLAKLDTGTEAPLVSLLKLAQAAGKLGYPPGATPTLGYDPLSFRAWGPAFAWTCAPGSPLRPPLDNPAELAAAIQCAVAAIVALITSGTEMGE